MPYAPGPAWGLIVPVKVLAAAKSRLEGYGSPARERLALAFAADVVAAGLACARVVRVLVVTDDPHAAEILQALGADVAPDGPAGGLNGALSHGADLLRTAVTGCGVVTVPSDLPAVRAAHLDAALAVVPAGGRAFVADTESRGTTLLAAAAGRSLDPAYGAGSRLRHLRSGAVELPGSPALRRDVDTPGDLTAAMALGVGRHTAAALAYPGCFSPQPAQGTMGL